MGKKTNTITQSEWVKALKDYESSSIFDSRPACPNCGGKRSRSDGPRWSCGLCGKVWAKKYVGKKKFLPIGRPPCPQCGSKIIVSYGSQWRCNDCGRRWIKNFRKVIVPGPRPPCPSCGSTLIVSEGKIWHCNRCSRKWVKMYRGKYAKDEKVSS